MKSIVAAIAMLLATSAMAQDRNYEVVPMFPGQSTRAPIVPPSSLDVTVRSLYWMCITGNPSCRPTIIKVSKEAVSTMYTKFPEARTICSRYNIQNIVSNPEGVLFSIQDGYFHGNADWNAVLYTQQVIGQACRMENSRN